MTDGLIVSALNVTYDTCQASYCEEARLEFCCAHLIKDKFI